MDFEGVPPPLTDSDNSEVGSDSDMDGTSDYGSRFVKIETVLIEFKYVHCSGLAMMILTTLTLKKVLLLLLK